MIIKRLIRLIRMLFKRGDGMDGTWEGDLNHSIILHDDLKLVARYVNRGWGININNYTMCDVPSAYDLKFEVYEGKDWGYILPVEMIETLYFLFIPVWHIFYQKYIVRIPKEYLGRKDLASLIYDLIYHDHTDNFGHPNTRQYLHKDMRYVVQVLSESEGYPSIIIDKLNVGYDWDGGDQYPSGDRLCILNFE